MADRLLIVDGRKTSIFILQNQLKEYETEAAANGGYALKLFDKSRPDMVIMNIQTPGMNIHALLRVLKSATHYSYTPVVVISPIENPEARLQCLEAGADGFLVEPYNINDMKAILVNLNRLKKAHDAMRKAFESMVRLVSQLEEQDEYLKGHALRTAYYAVELSKEMTFIKSFHDQVRMAAMIHDMGMLSLDQSLSRKSGKLSVDEHTLIKMHIAKVLELCQAIPFYEGLAESVKYHHERYDGSGYPEGLSGDGIPLGARVLSLVDAFDALTTKRSYRDAMSVEEAIAIIKKNEGPQWDPRLVNKFVEMVASGKLNANDLPCDVLTGTCDSQ